MDTTMKPSKAARVRAERLQRLKDEAVQERVRVEPANDIMRKLMKHPSGTGFRGQGSADWPLDSFTRRRLTEGSIKRVEIEKAEARPSEPHKPEGEKPEAEKREHKRDDRKHR
jgi:hypothetical protein